MPPLRERNIEDIEKFTDHFISTIVMLKEQNRWHELKPNSMLYTSLIEKISRPMLSNYFWCTSEHFREESLVTLCGGRDRVPGRLVNVEPEEVL